MSARLPVTFVHASATALRLDIVCVALQEIMPRCFPGMSAPSQLHTATEVEPHPNALYDLPAENRQNNEILQMDCKFFGILTP